DGQLATFISSPISDRSIDASAWDPTTNMALLAGNNDTIAEFDGTNTNTSIAPPSTNCTRDNTCVYHSVRWSPSGSYALIGGDNSTLYKYQQGSLTKQNTAVLFEVYPHRIFSISFNPDGGIGLIAGALGLTVIATETKCDYNIFSNADRKSTRLNSSHGSISYAVFCLKKKIKT